METEENTQIDIGNLSRNDTIAKEWYNSYDKMPKDQIFHQLSNKMKAESYTVRVILWVDKGHFTFDLDISRSGLNYVVETWLMSVEADIVKTNVVKYTFTNSGSAYVIYRQENWRDMIGWIKSR